MATLTQVFKFIPDADPAVLEAKISAFNALPKAALDEFCTDRGISSDNLVSEIIDRLGGLRTVVRSFPDETFAGEYAQVCADQEPNRTNSYPGKTISLQVNA